MFYKGEREPHPEFGGWNCARGGGQWEDAVRHLEAQIQDGDVRSAIYRGADELKAGAGAGKGGNKDDGAQALSQETGREKSAD